MCIFWNSKIKICKYIPETLEFFILEILEALR
uniref:Uncharacterized protein n=1 Tax=Arundo donax TaxID=35708 RepID=A0A0A9AL30_ARUDO